MKKTRKSVTRSTHKLRLIPTTQEPKLREPGAYYRLAIGRKNLFSKERRLQAEIVIWRRLRGGHLKPIVPKKMFIQLWKPMVRNQCGSLSLPRRHRRALALARAYWTRSKVRKFSGNKCRFWPSSYHQKTGFLTHKFRAVLIKKSDIHLYITSLIFVRFHTHLAAGMAAVSQWPSVIEILKLLVSL